MIKINKNFNGKSTIFEIKGMHCVSCAMNIDGLLEDTPGVIKAETNFAKSVTYVSYDKKIISTEKLKEIIKRFGYQVIITLNNK